MNCFFMDFMIVYTYVSELNFTKFNLFLTKIDYYSHSFCIGKNKQQEAGHWDAHHTTARCFLLISAGRRIYIQNERVHTMR